jgi:hypothetical protein
MAVAWLPTAPRASCTGPLKPERPNPDPVQENRTIPSHTGRPPASRVSPSVLAFIALAYVYALRRIVRPQPLTSAPRPIITGRAAWTRLLCGPSSSTFCLLLCHPSQALLLAGHCPPQPISLSQAGGVVVSHCQSRACPLHRTTREMRLPPGGIVRVFAAFHCSTTRQSAQPACAPHHQ